MEFSEEDIEVLVQYFKLLIEIEKELIDDGAQVDYLEDEGEGSDR